jgi:anti-sigma factor RsiW
MDCDVSPLLSAYVDGELDDADRSNVEAHLESCAACRSTVEDFRSIGSMTAGYAPASGPFESPRALAAVLARGRAPLWRRRVSVPAAVLPTVAVLAAGGVFLITRTVAPENAKAPTSLATGEVSRFDRGRPPIIAVIPTIIELEEQP